MMPWVVRGGYASPRNLQASYKQHALVPSVHGFSVQYQPGKTIDELARAGRLPNTVISYQTDDVLAAATRPPGYTAQLMKTPGTGHHHTFVVVYDASGAMLRSLPFPVAQALSQAFMQRPNPSRVP